MPSHQRRRGGEPAKHALRNHAPGPLQRWPSKQRTGHGLNKLPRQTVQVRHYRCADQDQRRSDRQKQQMLNHVDRQQLLVECRERRAHCRPDQKQPEKKTARARSWNGVHRRRSKMHPTAQVQKRCEQHGYGEWNWKRPRRQYELSLGWHGTHYGCARSAFSWLTPSTASRDASRAGACPAGCKVLRNDTSAVVCAGLRLLPYAGMLPPPWMTWRMSWSCVSRTATLSRAGPRCPPLSPREWQLRHCFTWKTSAPCR